MVDFELDDFDDLLLDFELLLELFFEELDFFCVADFFDWAIALVAATVPHMTAIATTGASKVFKRAFILFSLNGPEDIRIRTSYWRDGQKNSTERG